MSTSLVVPRQRGCAGASSSHPSFWGPSISETLPQSTGSFFLGLCGARLQHPWLPVLLEECRVGHGGRRPSNTLGSQASTETWVILRS